MGRSWGEKHFCVGQAHQSLWLTALTGAAGGGLVGGAMWGRGLVVGLAPWEIACGGLVPHPWVMVSGEMLACEGHALTSLLSSIMAQFSNGHSSAILGP